MGLTAASRQLVEQCLRIFQISGVETLSEPAIDRREKVDRVSSYLPNPRVSKGVASPRFPPAYREEATRQLQEYEGAFATRKH